MILRVTLPRNRNIPGELVALDDDGYVIHQCPVLGKADNARAAAAGNPTRNPLLPFGDTPRGSGLAISAARWLRLERMASTQSSS